MAATSAVHVARFPADGKNGAVLLSAQRLPGGTGTGFCW